MQYPASNRQPQRQRAPQNTCSLAIYQFMSRPNLAEAELPATPLPRLRGILWCRLPARSARVQNRRCLRPPWRRWWPLHVQPLLLSTRVSITRRAVTLLRAASWLVCITAKGPSILLCCRPHASTVRCFLCCNVLRSSCRHVTAVIRRRFRLFLRLFRLLLCLFRLLLQPRGCPDERRQPAVLRRRRSRALARSAAGRDVADVAIARHRHVVAKRQVREGHLLARIGTICSSGHQLQRCTALSPLACAACMQAESRATLEQRFGEVEREREGE